MKLQAVKGTHDLLPEALPAWRLLEGTARDTLTRAGARELRSPLFEFSEVFTRAVGASSDLVVQKEMFTFEDRGGRSLTLRPEFTAGVLRAFIEHGMHTLPTPVKLWSHGPAFRAENVQRGRYRQFHQINLEILGLAGPLVDAEAIALLYRILEAVGLRDLTVRLGSVGDPEDRARFNTYFRAALTPHLGRLSETSRERLRLNPLRIFDSKDPGDQELIAPLKRPLEFLGDASREHFDQVRDFLAGWGIPVEPDPSIVRGLDYYRRTAFEIHHAGVGAQSALGGGGRYDGLVESLGGPPTPGIGWALGMERVIDAMTVDGVPFPEPPAPLLFLVPLDDAAVAEVADLAFRLRRSFWVEHAYLRRNPGKGLRDADRAGAAYAGLRGDRERSSGGILLKRLADGQERLLAVGEVHAFLSAEAARPAAGRGRPEGSTRQ